MTYKEELLEEVEALPKHLRHLFKEDGTPYSEIGWSILLEAREENEVLG